MVAIPVRDLLPSYDLMVSNVLTIFDAASTAELNEGLHWYELAHLFAHKISGGNTRQGAGVIAAMSPQKRWFDNMFLAIRAFETGKAHGQVGLCNSRAQSILDGADPNQVLGGKKVRSFFRLIWDPSDPLSVCVDRHAFDIVTGETTDDKARKLLERKGGYSYVASVYRKAGEVVEVLPSAVQAVAWVVWRNSLGVT